MQDLHAIGDGSGGGEFIGVGDRRLRPHNHQQALKCPRCDSINTKFCYYNNYNLSQPRHFCKSCRRYWTKGGILRNVPVGGGCRKTKRSKAKTTADSSSGDAQSSSSDSSNLTAAAAATAEEGSAPSNTASSNSAVVYNVDVNPNFDHQPLDEYPSTDGQIFSTEMGSFAALMASPEEMMAAFGTADIQTTSYGRGQLPVDHAPAAENPSRATVDEFKMEDMSNDGLAAALDWGGGGDQGLFDLTGGVDPGYWDQSEWTDNDQSLNYLP